MVAIECPQQLPDTLGIGDRREVLSFDWRQSPSQVP